MPVSELLKSPFVPDKHYHLVFKSIDKVLLFRDNLSYTIFLERFVQFTRMVFDNWAVCLLNNHAHFIIKTKPLEKVMQEIIATDIAKQTVAMKKLVVTPNDEKVFDEMVERQINSFMVSYANYTKNKYYHDGGVFQKPFKRIAIDTDAYLQMAIIYVHANAVKHKVHKDYKTYAHNSYATIVESNNFFCAGDAVLDFFGRRNNFILLHEEQINYYYQKGFPVSKLE